MVREIFQLKRLEEEQFHEITKCNKPNVVMGDCSVLKKEALELGSLENEKGGMFGWSVTWSFNSLAVMAVNKMGHYQSSTELTREEGELLEISRWTW